MSLQTDWLFVFQGIYKMNNIVIENTEFIPLFQNTKGFFDLQFMVKLPGMKSYKFVAHLVFFGEFLRN